MTSVPLAAHLSWSLTPAAFSVSAMVMASFSSSSAIRIIRSVHKEGSIFAPYPSASSHAHDDTYRRHGIWGVDPIVRCLHHQKIPERKKFLAMRAILSSVYVSTEERLVKTWWHPYCDSRMGAWRSG